MTPWQGDACSLVEEFRAGRRSPGEELAATYAAIDASDLNAFCFIATRATPPRPPSADVSKPFGGVPIGVKELDHVAGWPSTQASVPLRRPVGQHHARRWSSGSATPAARCSPGRPRRASSAASTSPAPSCTAPRTTRGSTARRPAAAPAASAAAVAGGIVTLATGGDGGGSIRIPAGFCGLVGLKATYGRIPLRSAPEYGNLTVTIGCLSRSVRDTARWFDVANGHHAARPAEPAARRRVGGRARHPRRRAARPARRRRRRLGRRGRVAGDVGAARRPPPRS